jgi:predicted nucleotidyltransferase
MSAACLPPDVLADLRARVCLEAHVRVAALVGSASRGQMGRDSDVDVYLVLERRAIDSMAWRAALTADLEQIVHREVDLIVEDRERTSLLLRARLVTEGVLIFERAPSAWVTAKANAIIDYGDMAEAMALAVRRGRERLLGGAVHG